MFLIVGGDSELGAAAYRALKAQGAAVAATTRRRDRVAPDRGTAVAQATLSFTFKDLDTRAAIWAGASP